LSVQGKLFQCSSRKPKVSDEDFKLEKGPTDRAKEPDPVVSDQQNLGLKKLKN